MDQIIQIRKRRAIYIPKEVSDRLGLKEGDKMVLEVRNGRIILTPLKPLDTGRYWAEIGYEEVERVGEEITRSIVRD